MRLIFGRTFASITAAAIAIFFLATPLVCSSHASGHAAARDTGAANTHAHGEGESQGESHGESHGDRHGGDSHDSGELCALGAALAPGALASARFSPQRAARLVTAPFHSLPQDVPQPVPI